MLLGFRYRPSVARTLIIGALEGAVIAGALTWFDGHNVRDTIFGILAGAIACGFLAHLFQMYDDRRTNRARREAGQ